MSDIMDRAKALEEQGFVVVPVHSVGPDRKTCSCPKAANCGTNAGKHPIGDDWQKRRSGVDLLAELIEKGRKPNLGILPEPSKVIVVDIDPRNGGDVTMAAFVEEHGSMPRTKIVKTGSDGWHYYFRAPEGVELKGSLGPGIDLKHNGMVVAEGSRSWSGDYAVLTSAELAEVPQWILDEAKKPTYERPEPTPAPQADVDPDDPDLPRRQSYATSAIAGEVKRLDEMAAAKAEDMSKYRGEPWNNTLFNVACNIFEFANTPEANLEPKDAVTLLLDHAPRDSGFGDAEILKVVESARDRVGSTGREYPKPPIDPFGVAADDLGGEPVPTPIARMAGREWKDQPVADSFCEHHADNLRYAKGLGWLRWSPIKGIWDEIDDDLVVGLSGEFAKALAKGAIDTGDDHIRKAANARLNGGPVSTVAKLARGAESLRVDVDELNADPELLNCPNGYVDLRTGRLIAHNPDKMMTQVTGCAYNPEAVHPDVDEMLEALDPDEREWLQMMLGQAITGYTPKEDFLTLLHGAGANGKSAIVGTLLAAAGTYGKMLSEKVLTANSNAHTTEVTELLGARVAILEELPEGAKFSGKRMKDIAGTATLTARRMNRDQMTWKATHTVFITTNHVPRISETDHGTWRRPVLLDFPYRFVPTESAIETENDRLGDLGLRQRLKLTPQKEAFLAWVVEGAKKYLALGTEELQLTEGMQEAKKAWRYGVDPTGRFLDEMVVFDPTSCIPSGDLYEELGVWLVANGHLPWSSQTATTRLETHHAILTNDCKKTRVTVGPRVNISPRPGPVSVAWSPGQKVRVWSGMRWRTDADDGIESPQGGLASQIGA